ncbi:hypothetical protein SAMN04489841_3647 [Natrinema salaciae]|uniref:Uncharacterized protein n=1 Tax=Natrinema salaciae TaxID=1186196 RepID=A0A1H9NLG5_9EURY|nr:hypothetical protein SAMN04489841_3647 [Natrinema salaciae]
MSDTQNRRRERVLIRVGGLAFVIQLIVFQNSLGVMSSPGVSGTLRDILSGGLLLVAVVCLVGGVYLRQRGS